jgi:hypothetical protein
MGYHALGYGDILYERIGSIRIMQDGVDKRNWELGGLLPKLRFDRPRTSKEPIFVEWTNKALKIRMKNGLPVSPDLVMGMESMSIGETVSYPQQSLQCFSLQRADRLGGSDVERLGES